MATSKAPPRRPRVGLALGGGAARGMAHLGILEVFEEEQIPLDFISGTSFGAFCGGVYADTLRAYDLTARARAFMHSEAYRKLTVHLFNTPDSAPGFFDGTWRTIKKGITVGGGLSRPSVIGDDEYRTIIDALVPDVAIEELKRPFAAVAVDLRAGAEVVFRSGSLRKAVMASAAIPGLFPPQRRGDAVYIDGAWADCVPVEPARALGAEVVIAVDVTPEGPEELGDLKRSLEVAWVANTVTRSILKNRQLKLADLVIRPKVEALHWANFEAFEHARELGRQAAKEALPAVRALCGLTPPTPEKVSWWKRKR